MRITTWNVNGLRAALRKGFAEHIERIGPDVLLLQEVRARPEQLPGGWARPAGWNVLWHPAERKGYAGVAVWSRRPMKLIGIGMDGEADPEGRILRVQVGEVLLASVYLPSGSHSDQRQEEKREPPLRVMEAHLGEVEARRHRTRAPRRSSVSTARSTGAETSILWYATCNPWQVCSSRRKCACTAFS